VQRFTIALLSLSLVCSASAQPTNASKRSRSITIARSGSQPSSQEPSENFTGSVRIDPLFPAAEPSQVSCGRVTFAQGARTAWHTHPLGQILIVTAGTGWVRHEGGPVQEMREGDVVRIPPGVKHWHGAAATMQMTHIAIQEAMNGKAVDWMEKVTEEQYTMAKTTEPGVSPTALSAKAAGADLNKVAPALEKFAQDRLYGEVWKRPGLSARDRSIVTVAALIARNQTSALTDSMTQALDSGVTPGEISEMITHLAYYSGWGNALGAVGAAKDVFAQRGIGADQLPPAAEKLLPMNQAAEAQRATQVQANFGAVAPGVVQYTTDVLFRDLWLRPALAPRDRSLVTVSALVASGQAAQISYHLNRAMDNGLTREQASEVLTHLAFYAGWPNVFSALPVFKEVFEKRAQ
jgi:4-carboxymuconolactone decarboxylase